jgi:hypothetical protein
MLYTPVPGTPLFFEMKEQGRMLEGVNLADIHGQHQFNFRHAAISREDSKVLLDWAFRRDFERNGPSIYRICRTTFDGWLRYKDWAFRRDFERNGPSIYRICRTTFDGWLRYKNDADLRVRARFAWEARALGNGYAAALWAMEKHLRRTNAAVAAKIRELRHEVGREFGLVSRLVTQALGPVLLWSVRREEHRLAAGQTYEPRTIVERRNWTSPPIAAESLPQLETVPEVPVA